MKKILFPTDFSETSENAFVYAIELAKIFNAELILLHTFDLPIIDSQAMPINYGTIYETIELANFEHFKKELPKLRAIMEERNIEHIAMNHILMDGDLIYNIKKVINQEHIDFVVMGTKGATGWIDSFIGTNTGSVISDISVPVLSVPIEAKYSKIETIAFTTRFRKKDIEALVKVLLFAKKVNAKVKCLYVKTSNSDVTNDDIKRWESIFNTEENLKFFIIPNENVKETIEDFLTGQDIDLLAMLTYKRNFFVELFTNTTTQKLSYHLKTPILAFHE
ncbi:universal stress protein [Flavobacterium paronense]|uniref:Universal stress protein n=1 Tax=Flavobacterium paronense TaxID=1392775 RepID=A0ABV5GC43_9FLAO|nr:universal stress protein [Flavobacterium paronense]MDN3677792.1 universal stress protein [Flavobacterium paronense]